MMSVAEARARLGVADRTVRRWIKEGRLPAETREGWFGPEYRLPVATVEAFARRRAHLREGPRAVETLTFQELLTAVDTPQARMAYLGWARTASSITPTTVLRWIQAWITEGPGASRGAQPVPVYPSRCVRVPEDD